MVGFVIGAAEVFAGKPGKYYRQDSLTSEGLITGDWSRCVRNVTVSSREHSVKFDPPNGTWQSCGAQGKVAHLNNYQADMHNFVLSQHWIRLEMYPDVLIRRLKMGVDPADNSYMPSVVVVSGGTSVATLMELNVVNVRNTDTSVTLLSNVEQVSLILPLQEYGRLSQ